MSVRFEDDKIVIDELDFAAGGALVAISFAEVLMADNVLSREYIGDMLTRVEAKAEELLGDARC